MLADPLLQKLLILRGNREASARVINWVAACTQDVMTGDADVTVLMDIIDALQDYVVATKVSLSSAVTSLPFQLTSS